MGNSLDPESVTPRRGSMYPAPFGEPLAGREKRALGDPLGLTQFGVNLATLRAGGWSSQRHWHENEDEFVYVLEGEMTLVTDVGETVLRPGMAAGFPAGNPDGHHLINRTDQACALSRNRNAPAVQKWRITATSISAGARKAAVSCSRARTASPIRESARHHRKSAASRGDLALSRHAVAARRGELPASPDLLGLCARGHRQERRVEGRLAHARETLPLPPLGQPRLRPGSRSSRRASPVRAVALREVAHAS